MILLHLQKFAKIQLEKFEIKFSKFSKISKFQQIKYSRRELNFHDFFSRIHSRIMLWGVCDGSVVLRRSKSGFMIFDVF